MDDEMSYWGQLQVAWNKRARVLLRIQEIVVEAFKNHSTLDVMH
jgi:hypothetical protein